MKKAAIVGRGLAGILLHYELSKRNIQTTIYHSSTPGEASLVAAGIWHPFVFKRLIPSWRALEAIECLKNTYREIENLLQKKLLNEIPVYKLISGEEEMHHWEKTIASKPYGKNLEIIRSGNKTLGKVSPAGYLDIKTLITGYNEYLQEKNLIKNQFINYQDIKISKSCVNILNEEYDHLIFAQGFVANSNPYFNHLPLTHTKGELLHLVSREKIPAQVLNKNIFVLSDGEGHYKSGSTYNWKDNSPYPTDEGKEEILEGMKNLNVIENFSVTHHAAGIRPTVTDRRPLLGKSEAAPVLSIFNGLGTRGVLLAPLLANELKQHLLNGTPLHPECDIKRFS